MTYIYSTQGHLYKDNSKSCKNIKSSISQNYNNQRIIDNFNPIENYNYIENFNQQSLVTVTENKVRRYIDINDIMNMVNNNLDNQIIKDILDKIDTNTYKDIRLHLMSKSYKSNPFIEFLIDLFNQSYIDQLKKDEFKHIIKLIIAIKDTLNNFKDRVPNQEQNQIYSDVRQELINNIEIDVKNYINNNKISLRDDHIRQLINIISSRTEQSIAKPDIISTQRSISKSDIISTQPNDFINNIITNTFSNEKPKQLPQQPNDFINNIITNTSKKYVEKPNIEFSPGYAMRDHTLYNIEPNKVNECLTKCDTISDCKGISYTKPTKTCWFKNATHLQTEKSDINHTSYIKQELSPLLGIPIPSTYMDNIKADQIIGANLISINGPDNKNTWFQSKLVKPYHSNFYVQYYNKNNIITDSKPVTIRDSAYDDPEITINFETPYTGTIKLFRSDSKNSPINLIPILPSMNIDFNPPIQKDIKYVKNVLKIMLRGGIAS